ncbi:MAG: transposase [Methanobrevibacter sp.]|nr:transposase [Candidatus Methanovirga basalitermitum]
MRENFGFKGKLDYNQLCEVFSIFEDFQILEFVIKRLNKEFKVKTRGKRTMIIDSTDIQFNINLGKHYYSKEKLKEKKFKIGFSSSKSYYIGGKLTLAIDKDTCQVLTMLFHPGAVSDTEIYLEILENLKKRRILRYENLIEI